MATQTGKRVAKLRKQKRMSQLALGLAIGMDQSRLSRLEGGEGNWLEEQIIAVAKVLGTTPYFLMSGKSENAPDSTIPIPLITPGDQATYSKRAMWANEIRPKWPNFDDRVMDFFKIYLSDDPDMIKTLENMVKALADQVEGNKRLLRPPIDNHQKQSNG